MQILPTSYLPPISWFVSLLNGEPTCIEQYEHFRKQTIRNRCTIDSPNGKLNLTIPVDKSNFGAGGKCLMKDVMISDHQDWRRQHWSAFETSYYNSPFFEYLQDDFRVVYESKWKYLMDFNEELMNVCLSLLDVERPVARTSEYVGVTEMPGNKLAGKEYYQVFSQKHGFLSDLSIIDMIFNMGPESVLFLLPKY